MSVTWLWSRCGVIVRSNGALKWELRGIEAVACDNNGQVIGGMNQRVWSDDVETLEVVAIYKVTRLATDHNWTRLEIESNSQVVFNQLWGASLQWCVYDICTNTISLVNRIKHIVEGNTAVNQWMYELVSQIVRLRLGLDDWVSPPLLSLLLLLSYYCTFEPLWWFITLF